MLQLCLAALATAKEASADLVDAVAAGQSINADNGFAYPVPGTNCASPLFLLRHAKAEPVEFGTPDFERPLIKRGRDAAKLMGRHMAKEGIVPDRILCSPSARTRETLDRVMKHLDAKPETVFPDDLYNAPTGIYIEQIREHGGNAKRLMVVGHNPATEEALAYLTDPARPRRCLSRPAPSPSSNSIWAAGATSPRDQAALSPSLGRATSPATSASSLPAA